MRKTKGENPSEKKESREAKFIRSKRESIIQSFNETVDKKLPMWELPVVSQSFMNLSSGTIYGPANATFLHNQMSAKRCETIFNEYRKYPILKERMDKLMEGKEGITLLVTDVLDLQSALIKASVRNKKIKAALDEAHKNIESKEVGPYFVTWNQGRNIYDFKGSKKFYVLHRFFYDIKTKKIEDEPEEPENNDPENTNNVKDPKNDKSGKEDKEEKDKKEEKEEKEDEFILVGRRRGEKVTDLFNRSHLKVLEGLEEPKAFTRRIAAFEKPVLPEEIRTVIKALTKSSIYPVTRISGKKSGSFFNGLAVNIPASEFFKSDLEELHTLAHEIAHSYGGAADKGVEGYARFKRDYFTKYHDSPKDRGAEELIANVAAGALLNAFNIKSTSEERQSAFEANNEVYDLSWATHLRNNPEDVVRAIEMAEKISSQMTFLVKKELKLMLEKDPKTPMPSLVKEEIESLIKKEDLDPEIAKDYVPTFKEEKTKVFKPAPYRRGR